MSRGKPGKEPCKYLGQEASRSNSPCKGLELEPSLGISKEPRVAGTGSEEGWGAHRLEREARWRALWCGAFQDTGRSLDVILRGTEAIRGVSAGGGFPKAHSGCHAAVVGEGGSGESRRQGGWLGDVVRFCLAGDRIKQ